MRTGMKKGWLLVCLIACLQANAQVVLPLGDTVNHRKTSKRAPEPFMTRQIKHISEFIDRFNKAALLTDGREMALLALFDEDDKRLAQKGRASHPYTNQVNAFIRASDTGTFKISKRGIAHAVIGILMAYKDLQDTLIVHLKKDYTADSAAFWHVVKVDKLKTLAKEKVETRQVADARSEVALPPNSNEVSFLPFLRGLHDYQSLVPFTHCRDCLDDAWWQVENALRDGGLIPQAVVFNRIFLKAANWEIELGEFIREKENSGWLISNITEN
ncbi:hypothetical protein LZD49_02925 [Dyadobacter sp. CY261]|uniref:hypothetical protein n=1 Tax=Dyadobacter sp. CY261 TaxID=2907203 RepID=UPI001F2FBD79|nr:hypothetical protein [Dyadobacter sp. CY261]MCF0069406.1 hypothetical protein [Dyadobacter sp. CY261]